MNRNTTELNSRIFMNRNTMAVYQAFSSQFRFKITKLYNSNKTLSRSQIPQEQITISNDNSFVLQALSMRFIVTEWKILYMIATIQGHDCNMIQEHVSKDVSLSMWQCT